MWNSTSLRSSDLALVDESGIADEIAFMSEKLEQPLHIYGDGIYADRVGLHIRSPYRTNFSSEHIAEETDEWRLIRID